MPAIQLRTVSPATKISAFDVRRTDIVDKNGDGVKRSLPGNEKSAMALNEFAAEAGRGFFLYLPSKDVWKTVPDSTRLPATRVPVAPRHAHRSSNTRAPKLTKRRASFPALVYMDYTWSEEATARFFKTPHRARYLSCDAVGNSPHHATPLFAIQFSNFAKSILYATSTASLILLCTDTAYFLATTLQVEQAAGRWQGKKPPADPDIAQRLQASAIHGLWTGAQPTEAVQDMQQYQLPDLREVYLQIVDMVERRKLVSTMTADELRDLIPRPVAPERGEELGTPIEGLLEGSAAEVPGTTEPSAEPPSRRLVRKPRRGRSKPVDAELPDGSIAGGGGESDVEDDP